MEEKDAKISDLEAKLAESEEKVKHWHNLYNERDRQFQSVRQRYHLLNKLQSNYDKKDKLHLAYMQCAELIDENEQLKQQLKKKEKERELDNIFWKQECDSLQKALADKEKEMSDYVKIVDNLHQELSDKCDFCEDNNIQAKTDFAIEQLEKVKEFITTDKDWQVFEVVNIIEKQIDQQIKELKEK